MTDNHQNGISALIVDDNKCNQIFAYHAIKADCTTVDFAENGREAVSMVQQGLYDLILMDIAMPVMDGITATALIRADKGKITKPVIIGLTAHDNYNEDCLKAGMDTVIQKPYCIKSLNLEIKRQIALKQKRSISNAG